MITEALKKIASHYIGDGQQPNFFIATREEDVVMVTDDGQRAYSYWLELSHNREFECALEDRQHGVLCEVSQEEGSKCLAKYDNFEAKWATKPFTPEDRGA
jgi:hypothetical protein